MQSKPAQTSTIRGEDPTSAPTTNIPLDLGRVAALAPRDRGALDPEILHVLGEA